MSDGIHTLRGSSAITLPVTVARMLRFSVVSSGCSIYVGQSLEDCDLVYSGTGAATVKVPVRGNTLLVIADEQNAAVRLDVPETREEEAGWLNEPSLTDLNPRPFGTISPEIKAVMDQMNRNAIAREQALLRSLGNR